MKTEKTLCGGEGESSASGLNISQAEAALEEALRKGWFSIDKKLEAEDKILQTGGGGASRRPTGGR